MKRVVTNSEVPHLWAHQSQQSARNGTGSFFFEGPTIYSYGSHFPIAAHVTNKRGDKAVLLTTRGYSVTTGAHIGQVRRAIPNDVQVFNVEMPSAPMDPGAAIAAVASYNERITAAEYKAARARLDWSRNYQLSAAAELHAEATTFVKFYSLKGKQYRVAPLRADLAEIKRAASADAARTAAETRTRKLRLEAEHAEQIAAWEQGASGFLPYDVDTRLRVKDDEVETSLGARFPVSHAKRGLALVDATVASGQQWLPTVNEHGGVRRFPMGNYHIDRIDANGTVYAGCHVIPLKSINRVRDQIVQAAAQVELGNALDGVSAEDQP